MSEEKKLKRYQITHMPTGEVVEKEASDLSNAIAHTDWAPEDCEIELVPTDTPVSEPDTRRGRGKRKESEPIPGADEAEETADNAKDSVGLQRKVIEDGGVATAEPPTDEGTYPVGASEYGEENEEGQEPLEGEVVPSRDSAGVLGEPSPAEAKAYEHKLHIEALAVKAEVMFLEMGRLLYDARENGEWAILHYETFKDYVAELKLPMQNSYSWSTRLANIYEFMVVKGHLNTELLARIGVSKLIRLLPAAREGKLTDELIEKALELSDMDLRIELGHNVGESGGEDKPDLITCPRCGNEFDQKKADRAH